MPPAHLEDFVVDFNLPVLLLCWILTDIINVPARLDEVMNHVMLFTEYEKGQHAPYDAHLLMMSVAPFTFSLSLLKVWIIITEASTGFSEKLCKGKKKKKVSYIPSTRGGGNVFVDKPT